MCVCACVELMEHALCACVCVRAWSCNNNGTRLVCMCVCMRGVIKSDGTPLGRIAMAGVECVSIYSYILVYGIGCGLVWCV